MRFALRRTVRALGIATALGLSPLAAANATIPGTPTVPEPTPVHHVAVHGEPEIADVEWGDTEPILHPGSVIAATVITSDNVGYVEARVRFWNVVFRHTAPGRFELNYRVPLLPPAALGSWQVAVIARSIDGVEVKRTYRFAYHYF